MNLLRGLMMICVVGAMAGATHGNVTWLEDFDAGASGGTTDYVYENNDLLLNSPDSNWGRLRIDGAIGVGNSGAISTGLAVVKTGTAQDDGIDGTFGVDSVQGGGPNGNSYDFSGLGGPLVTFSYMANNIFSSPLPSDPDNNGYQQGYLGDATIGNTSADNYYRIDTTYNKVTLELVADGALEQTISTTYTVSQGWTRFDFVPANVGTPTQTISIFETDVDDNDPAGAPVGTTNLLGVLGAPSEAFDLDHFGIAYGPDNFVNGGGAALGPFDNFAIEVPEPASLMLLGLGTLALVRRNR